MKKKKKDAIMKPSSLTSKKEVKRMSNKLERELNAQIKEKHGLTIAQIKKIARTRKAPKSKKVVLKKATREFTFGVITDTHLCSTLCKLDELNAFYDLLAKRGVKDVLHAGDLLAGNGKMFRGQLSEMTCYGFDAQSEEVIEKYPVRKNVTTHIIAGNHDLSFYNDNGADIVKTVSDEREDINYLGHFDATIVMGGVKIKLLHPDAGGAYALTYKSQKMVEQMDNKNKPDIFILGHWHTSCYYKQCDVHVIHGGCWEGQGSYLLRKGLYPSIGGWIVTVKTDAKGNILSLIPEFISFD